MKLADYQRTLMRLSFAREATETDFEGFGDRARFLMYRQMIRSRLLGMAKQAFRASMEVVGARAFELSFDRYLAESPPRSPLIRDVIADFGPFAGQDTLLLSEAPTFAADLVRFEEAKWRVAYRKQVAVEARPGARERTGEGTSKRALGRASEEPGEFDFSSVPVFNPALEQISLAHRVHELEGGRCRAEPCQLLVYRPPQHDDLRWYVADTLFSRVLSGACAQPDTSLAELVRNAAQSLGKALDEALLEELATGVTLALQRGVLLGSR